MTLLEAIESIIYERSRPRLTIAGIKRIRKASKVTGLSVHEVEKLVLLEEGDCEALENSEVNER